MPVEQMTTFTCEHCLVEVKSAEAQLPDNWVIVRLEHTVHEQEQNAFFVYCEVCRTDLLREIKGAHHHEHH